MNVIHRRKFGWTFLPGSGGARASHDHVVMESENFVVLPSLGSIVPGWLLLIPKFPIDRLADLEKRHHEEFKNTLSVVQKCVAEKFGTPSIFEHGGRPGSELSCGVDQAHLHIVPLNFNLAQEVVSDDTYDWVALESSATPMEIALQVEYLFVSSSGQTYFAEVERPVSQWFRRKIATKLGCASEWNYRDFPFLNNINETLNAFGKDG